MNANLTTRFTEETPETSLKHDPPANLRWEQVQAGAVSALLDDSAVRCVGEDATDFLQGQTTNDLKAPPEEEARWHGYCLPNGRLLTTMLLWRTGPDVQFILPDSLCAPILQRLSMFVLRAKATLQRESPVLLGVYGSRAAEALLTSGLQAPAAMTVWKSPAGMLLPTQTEVQEASAIVIGLPATCVRIGTDTVTIPRWLVVLTATCAQAISGKLAELLTVAPTTLWRWLEIRSGFPRITPEISGKCIPQSLQFDRLGGVSFQKGCYPGQEIVARSHYLGKVKRCCVLGQIAGTHESLKPGAAVLNEANEPIGFVVSHATSPILDVTGSKTSEDLLMEIPRALADHTPVTPLKIEDLCVQVNDAFLTPNDEKLS